MRRQREEKQIEPEQERNAGRGRRQRLTQQAIVAAAAELFARKGFGATSLDDIAAVLGASKASLYYHIKNKEEILRLIFLTVLTVSEEPLRRIVESELAPQEKLRLAIEHQSAGPFARNDCLLPRATPSDRPVRQRDYLT
jgi:AcrR family transcriptional regulator